MKIAVIVPVYNVAPYLKRCVDALLAQTHRDFALMLVDDGSTDGSGAICDDYAVHDARVRVLHQANGGLSAARNAALDCLAREGGVDFVSFVDSDDWVSPDYLSELVRGLSSGAEIAAVRLFRAVDEKSCPADGGPVSWQTVSPRTFWSMTSHDPASACGKLYAWRLFDGIRYPVGKINEDERTTYRVFFRAGKVACASCARYAYFLRPGSIMSAPWSVKRLDRLEAWRDQIRFFSERGYPELVANSRKWMSVDLVDAIRHLRNMGERAQAARLRAELVALLKDARFPMPEYYLAYKTAYPFRMRLWKLLGRV